MNAGRLNNRELVCPAGTGRVIAAEESGPRFLGCLIGCDVYSENPPEGTTYCYIPDETTENRTVLFTADSTNWPTITLAEPIRRF